MDEESKYIIKVTSKGLKIPVATWGELPEDLQYQDDNLGSIWQVKDDENRVFNVTNDEGGDFVKGYFDDDSKMERYIYKISLKLHPKLKRREKDEKRKERIEKKKLKDEEKKARLEAKKWCCKICGKKYKGISYTHLLKAHDMTIRDYNKRK